MTEDDEGQRWMGRGRGREREREAEREREEGRETERDGRTVPTRQKEC